MKLNIFKEIKTTSTNLESLIELSQELQGLNKSSINKIDGIKVIKYFGDYTEYGTERALSIIKNLKLLLNSAYNIMHYKKMYQGHITALFVFFEELEYIQKEIKDKIISLNALDKLRYGISLNAEITDKLSKKKIEKLETFNKVILNDIQSSLKSILKIIENYNNACYVLNEVDLIELFHKNTEGFLELETLENTVTTRTQNGEYVCETVTVDTSEERIRFVEAPLEINSEVVRIPCEFKPYFNKGKNSGGGSLTYYELSSDLDIIRVSTAYNKSDKSFFENTYKMMYPEQFI